MEICVCIFRIMIEEVQLPDCLSQLIATICRTELALDGIKGQLAQCQPQELIRAISLTNEDHLYLEDVYTFLKKQGSSLNKHQIGLVNRYFGFRGKEKLSPSEFRRHFLSPLKAINLSTVIPSDPEHYLGLLVKGAVCSNAQIQRLKTEVCENWQEVIECFDKFYGKTRILEVEIVKEMLFDVGYYSRANLALTSRYLLGDSNGVQIKQAFCNQSISGINKEKNVEKTRDQDTKRSQVIEQYRRQTIIGPREELKTEPHSHSGQEKAEISQFERRRSSSKQIGKLVRRSSVTAITTQNSMPTLVGRQLQRQDLNHSVSRITTNLIAKQPFNAIQNRENSRKPKISSNVKKTNNSEVYSQASTTAKLRIQEIERQVIMKSKEKSLHKNKSRVSGR